MKDRKEIKFWNSSLLSRVVTSPPHKWMIPSHPHTNNKFEFHTNIILTNNLKYYFTQFDKQFEIYPWLSSWLNNRTNIITIWNLSSHHHVTNERTNERTITHAHVWIFVMYIIQIVQRILSTMTNTSVCHYVQNPSKQVESRSSVDSTTYPSY